MEVFLGSLAVVLWGTFVSWAEERFGRFQDLSPSKKQAVNTLLTLVVPAAGAFLLPYWRPEFGNSESVITELLYVLAPIGTWVVSQVAHYYDPDLCGSASTKSSFRTLQYNEL